jgi:hypothetical protein
LGDDWWQIPLDEWSFHGRSLLGLMVSSPRIIFLVGLIGPVGTSRDSATLSRTAVTEITSLGLDKAKFAGTTSDACMTALLAGRKMIAEILASLGIVPMPGAFEASVHICSAHIVNKAFEKTVASWPSKAFKMPIPQDDGTPEFDERLAAHMAMRVTAARLGKFTEITKRCAELRNTVKFRAFVAEHDPGAGVANLAGMNWIRWRDAANFARHFNRLAFAIGTFQVAPHPIKTGKKLAPKGFTPFDESDFQLMTCLEPVFTEVEGVILCLEKTFRDVKAPVLTKGSGVFNAMRHLSVMLVDVVQAFRTAFSPRPAISSRPICRTVCSGTRPTLSCC